MNNFEKIKTEVEDLISDASDAIEEAKTENPLKDEFKKDPHKGSLKIAKYLTEKYHVKTIGENKTETYIYQDGIYVLGKKVLKSEIQNILGELKTINRLSEIVDTIQNISYVESKDFGNVDVDLINVENGILNLRTGELIDHSPEYQFTNRIPVVYDLKAQCPEFKRFLTEILEESDIPIIAEWFGYCLYREYIFKKALIAVGERNTGKTTLFNVLKTFIGNDNTCGVALQRLNESFAKTALFRKHLNLVDDLSYNDIRDIGGFKMLCGYSLIDAEKKFGDHFTFYNFAKLTYSCNKVPQLMTKDIDDEAYWDRWIIVNFTRQVDPKKQDKYLIHKLITPEEMSGILNFALIGLGRLFARGNFTYKASPDEIKEEMLRSDPLGAFAYEMLEEDPEGIIKKEDLYAVYVEFVKERKRPVETIEKVGRRLIRYAPYLITGMKLDNVTGKQTRIWRGVKVREISVFDGSKTEESTA